MRVSPHIVRCRSPRVPTARWIMAWPRCGTAWATGGSGLGDHGVTVRVRPLRLLRHRGRRASPLPRPWRSRRQSRYRDARANTACCPGQRPLPQHLLHPVPIRGDHHVHGGILGPVWCLSHLAWQAHAGMAGVADPPSSGAGPRLRRARPANLWAPSPAGRLGGQGSAARSTVAGPCSLPEEPGFV
jgi:hypothetical protein